jgi:dienelactone hydrolase
MDHSITGPTIRSVDMAEVLLFHHIQGLTEGVAAFADELRAAGHTVHAPDLFDGRTFDSIREGFAHTQEIGPETLSARADSAANALPEGLVYAGFSWGVGSAQRMAQTRAGARGALLYESCFPITGEWAFGRWPAGVPVQVHGKDNDEFFAHEGDIDAARELVETLGREQAELFVYPGDQHLFADRSLPSFDADAATLLTQRTLDFLARL